MKLFQEPSTALLKPSLVLWSSLCLLLLAHQFQAPVVKPRVGGLTLQSSPHWYVLPGRVQKKVREALHSSVCSSLACFLVVLPQKYPVPVSVVELVVQS